MLAHDIRLALRSLGQRPGFAAVAVLLLALGAGANAAVFSVVRGVLFKPLPFAEPERLVAVWPGEFVSNQDIGYFREHARSLDQVAGLSPGWLMSVVPPAGEALKVTGARVSSNLFAVLGAAPAVGRTIEPADNAAPVAVLGWSLWTTRFGGDSRVVGQSVVIDGQPHTIVGVMPRGFEVFEPGTDLWTVLRYDPAQPNHRTTFSQALARLAAGASPQAASQEIASLAADMRREFGYPRDWGQTLRAAPLREAVTGDVRQPLLILLGAVGVILLLAAVNLATLVLNRGLDRSRDMAVRAALGASRILLLRQTLVEQAVLAACGALAGLALARLALPVLVRQIPPEVPRVGEIGLDPVVFAVVLALATGLALLASLVPSYLATRPCLNPLLRQATTSTESRGRSRALSALVAAQVALAVVLGIGAGLLLRSLANLHAVDPGFSADRVLTFRVQTTSKHKALATGLPYLEQVVERVRALPGVATAGAIQHLPMSGYSWTTSVQVEGRAPQPGVSPPVVAWRFTGWDYFGAMGIPTIDGRTFRAADRAGAPPVAIVNDAFRRRFFHDGRAVGQHVVLSAGTQPTRVEIVGVVGDVRHRGLDVAPEPEVYRPLAQTFMFPMAIVVRTASRPSDLAPAVRRAVVAIDPSVPVADLQPLSTLLVNSLGRPRLLARLLSVFAAVGLLLCAVGVYGSVAHCVRRQQREIGIRLALGATPGDVLRFVLRHGLGLAAGGLAIGLPVALASSRVMRSLVFGLGPRDPFTFIALPLLVVAAVLAACYLPARRASRVDPATIVREG